MTVALSIKVSDGVVMACDSAVSQSILMGGSFPIYGRICRNANKMINLHKDLPIGVMTYGCAQIGQRSITLVLKDIRAKFMEPPANGGIDTATYTMEEVGQKFTNEINKELAKAPLPPGPIGTLGFHMAGYSAGQNFVELGVFEFTGDGSSPKLHWAYRKNEFGLLVGGDPETIYRLYYGYSPNLPAVLNSLINVQDPMVLSETMRTIQSATMANFNAPSMPIQEVIELADFLVDASIKFTRFNGAPQTIDGPIDIAAITQYEGFKWVRRKHYYDTRLNQGRD